MATFRVETDLIENLKRIYYFAKRIAKLVRAADVKGNDDQDEDTGGTAA